MSMNFKFGIEMEFADLFTDAVMRVLSNERGPGRSA